MPVWGFADVLESTCAEIPVGERLYGFFPIASHVILQPGHVSDRSLIDTAPHRQALPVLYNSYQRTNNDPPALRALEDDRCLFFPLFATSYIIYDFLVDNDWFGAEQVVVVSASSKTAFGLSNLIARHDGAHPRVIGLTSPRNVAFVDSLGTCDQIITYDTLASIDATRPTALVDMAGNGDIIAQLHHHIGDNIKLSSSVGATHWNTARARGDLPGARPTFFFAPAQFGKRESDWGPGVIMRRAMEASARIAAESKQFMHITHARGADAVQAAFARTISGAVRPEEGLILSMK